MKNMLLRLSKIWPIFAVVFLLLTIVPIAAFCSDLQPAKESKSMLTDQPYFQLRITVSNTPYAIDVNGAQVKIDMGGNPFNADIPINHWMRSGKNDITCILPAFADDKKINPKASCTIELIVHHADASSDTAQVVSRLEYSGLLTGTGASGTENSTNEGRYNSKKRFFQDDQHGDVIVSPINIGPIPGTNTPGKSFTQTVTLKTPFPEWAFFSSDNLEDPLDMKKEDYEKYRDDLFAVYKRVHDAIKAKNISTILPMFEERNRELDISFYYDPGTMAKKIAGALDRNANNPRLELVTFKPSRFRVERHRNTKLVSLQRSENPAIVFNYKDIDMSKSHDLIFRRQEGQWILTR